MKFYVLGIYFLCQFIFIGNFPIMNAIYFIMY